MLILSKTHSYLVTDAAAAEQRGNEIEVFYVITNVQKYKKKEKKQTPDILHLYAITGNLVFLYH